MKLLLPILWRRGLVVIVVTLSVGILHTQAQSDTTDEEIVFHVVKKRICEKEKPQTDLMREGLKGRVEAVRTEYHSGEFGSMGSKTLPQTTVVSQNENSDRMEMQVDTLVPRRDSRKRANKSNLYYVKSEYYDTTGTLTLSTTLSVKNKRKYNFSLNRAFINQRIGIDFINSNPGYYKRKDYQYDTKGRLTVIRVQGYSSADGHSPLRRRIPFSYICRYDNAGRCIESDMDNDHGRSFFTYDENGNCIKRIDRPVFGEPTITTYVYGENCKVKEANRTGHNKGKSSYEYDNKDSLIFQKEESLGQIRSGMEGTSDNDTTFIRYKYDDNGSKIEEKKVSGDMSGSYEKSYQYIYDEHGNWTRKDEFISKQKPGYYLRKITYY